jgi:glycerol-3-phosphate acyltransferase PlsY
MNALFVIVSAYALGCFSTAYYLFRLSTGRDLRSHGSGTAGARNIGRELGSLAFVVTFLIDCAKGLLAVALAGYFELGEVSVTFAMLAVVAGHIWPAQLGFHGGKGVATGLGALVAFDYKLLIPLILLTGVAVPLLRNFTLGGLVAILLTPITVAIFHHTAVETTGVSILAAIIIFAHRKDLREIFAKAPANSDGALNHHVERRQQ